MARPEPATAATFQSMIDSILCLDDQQLSAHEYRYVAELVRSKAGARFLVFGVGNDSELWLFANRGGRTLFLESSTFWIRQIRWRLPQIEIQPVTYGTRASRWRELLDGDPAALEMDLPDEVERAPWDIVFVDAPAGYSDDTPGRMKSIYTASRLAHHHPGTDVIVHDCDRPLERAYCDRFFAHGQLVRELDRTRHYRSLDTRRERRESSSLTRPGDRPPVQPKPPAPPARAARRDDDRR